MSKEHRGCDGGAQEAAGQGETAGRVKASGQG